MDINAITKFITEGNLILVPALWILGMFLKRTPNVPDWAIIWILLALGVTGSIFMNGINTDAILQGILATGVAVLGHQLIKQTVGKKNEEV
jgi:hypothetical protein